ncbi:hypothetical protein JCGZ_06841 [Jatropha curcas]|uniref:Aminotransferase-like plant mobile domain-containing protein n=1 Tax=Jatropha curcas TaxID=180498 RepID=A0A067KZQ3_JATCU|nr:hypothetical protein JCGZ_06841 [Jatropha curcas]
METLGAIPDIPSFDGEPVPVSRNPLTSGTRPLQLLPLPGTKFSMRYETSRMRGFQTELRDPTVEARGAAVEVCGASVLRTPYFEQLRGAAVKVRGAATEVRYAAVLQGRSEQGPRWWISTDASAFWDLLDLPMRARVIAAGFGDYVVGLHRTQPRFLPAMRYALMERWNDCTHTFVFGFGEMTLTPGDYAAITGLRFAGPVAPLDARTRLAAWRELPVEARLAAPAYTREERDQAARSFLVYIISSQLLCTSQNKGDPAVLVCLRDLGQVGSFDWATLALAHLYHGLDVWTRGSGESNWQFIRPLEVWAYKYRIYPYGPSGDTPTDSRRIPRYLAHCQHTYASTEDLEYWRNFLNDRALSDLLLTPWEAEAWRTYPGREVAELYTRSRLLLQGYWLDRYFLGERVCDIEVAPAQRRVPHAPPRHMCMLEGMTAEDMEEEYEGSAVGGFLSTGDYPAYFSTRMQARLPEVLEYTQERKTHKTTAHYRAEAAAEAEAAAVPAGPRRGSYWAMSRSHLAWRWCWILVWAWGRASLFLLTSSRLLHHRSWILSTPHTSCARGSGLLGPSSPSSILSVTRGYESYTHLPFCFFLLQSFLHMSVFTGSGDREIAEAPVSLVRCHGLTPDGGGSAPDCVGGGGDPFGLLQGG